MEESRGAEKEDSPGSFDSGLTLTKNTQNSAGYLACQYRGLSAGLEPYVLGRLNSQFRWEEEETGFRGAFSGAARWGSLLPRSVVLDHSVGRRFCAVRFDPDWLFQICRTQDSPAPTERTSGNAASENYGTVGRGVEVAPTKSVAEFLDTDSGGDVYGDHCPFTRPLAVG